MKEGRPCKFTTTSAFLETFSHCSLPEQHLVCELYMQEVIWFGERRVNLSPYVRDIQLRDFVSFSENHMKWRIAYDIVSKDRAKKTLWIRAEPTPAATVLREYIEFLSSPKIISTLSKIKQSIVNLYSNYLNEAKQAAMEGSQIRWEISDEDL